MTDFEQKYKDRHFKYSLIKSIVRMSSCVIFLVFLIVSLFVPDIWNNMIISIIAWSAMPIGFFIAEILGIMEEYI